MVLPFAIWNMRGFFLNIPKDIFESAAVEGANDWQILWKITFPLAAPGIVSTSVFAFINAWNDYMIAHTFMKDQSKYTRRYGCRPSRHPPWAPISAGRWPLR